MQEASNANSMSIFCALCYKLMNCDLDTSYTTDQSKRPNIDGNRSNGKKVQCLRCVKALNADNTKYYERSKHPGLAPPLFAYRYLRKGSNTTEF